MSYDITKTLAHDQLKQDGRRLFMETMAATDGKNVAGQVASGLQTLLETALNTKGQAAGAISLSRLAGYLGGVAEMAGAMTEAGVRFQMLEDDKGSPRMRMTMPGTKSKAPSAGDKPKDEPAGADLDKLEGPEYEAALAKMTPAESKKYLAEA